MMCRLSPRYWMSRPGISADSPTAVVCRHPQTWFVDPLVGGGNPGMGCRRLPSMSKGGEAMTRRSHSRGRRKRATAKRTNRDLCILRGQRALVECASFVGHAKFNDLHDLIELPAAIKPNIFAAVPGPLVKAGITRAIGSTPTCRPTGHGRPVTVWQVADVPAAKRWLRHHPVHMTPVSEPFPRSAFRRPASMVTSEVRSMRP